MLLTEAAAAWQNLTAAGSVLQIPASLPPPLENRLDHGDRMEIPTTPYSCQFCDRTFPRLSLLKKHEQTHSDHLPFKCDYCQRLFKHKRSRDRHVKLHTGDKKYKCEQCEAAFSRSDHLKIHVKTHDSRKPFQCSLCQRGYNTGAALTSHMLNHRRESGSVSSTSSAATSLTSSRISQSPLTSSCSPATPPQSPVASNEERRRDTGSSRTSSQAREEPKTPEIQIKTERPPTPANSSHEELEQRHSSPQGLKCQYCGQETFSTLEALSAHVQALHGPSFSALKPSSSSESPSIKVEEGPAPSPQSRPHDFQLPFGPQLFMCHMCSGRFTSLAALHQHTMASHNINDVLRLYYPSVMRVPVDLGATDLSKKEKIENGLLLTCPQCPLSFQDLESYSIHLKNHWETALRMTQGLFPQRVACPDCGLDMTNFDQAQADAHAASHILTTSVEYGCQACMKTFVKPDELQKHLLDIHAHHLYKCSLCKEVFDSKVSIQVHFAVKHSDECKLYRCTLCSTICKSELEFSSHVKTVHSPVMPTPSAYRCKVCSEGFAVEFLLERHLQTEHGIFSGYPYFSARSEAKCERCNEHFPSAAMLLLHIQSAHLDDTHSCSICGEVLRSRDHLDAHLKTHQSPARAAGVRLKCNICDDFFSSQLELSQHKLRHYKVQGRPQCLCCKAVMNTVEDFRAHTKMHTADMPFTCIVCKQSVGTDPELELHAQFHTQMTEEAPSYPCIHCRATFGSDDELRDHVTSHLVIGPAIDCKICKQCLESPSTLQQHLIEHTYAGHSSYPCGVCNAIFTQAASLQRHVAEHSLDARPYSCNDCNMRFFFPAELEHHVVVHQPRSPREFKCDDCSQTFPSLSMLSHHRIIHDNVSSPVKCPECPATFSEGSSMITHFRSLHENHSEEKQDFKCTQCGADFPCLSNLQGHMKMHTLESCFKCELCSKEFALQRNLQIHMRSHNGERPYSCRICDKRFARKENRKAHEKAHTGIKPFTCSVCSRAFTRKCHLREHKKLHEKTSQDVEEMNYTSDESDEEVNVDDL